jgi:hypothetical protein
MALVHRERSHEPVSSLPCQSYIVYCCIFHTRYSCTLLDFDPGLSPTQTSPLRFNAFRYACCISCCISHCREGIMSIPDVFLPPYSICLIIHCCFLLSSISLQSKTRPTPTRYTRPHHLQRAPKHKSIISVEEMPNALL